MGVHQEITVIKLFDSATVTGTTTYSEPLDIGTYGQGGTFSIQYYAATAGVSTSAVYLVSNDGINFVQSTQGSSIFTGIHGASGSATNGRDLLLFSPIMGRFMKIGVWLTAGATSTFTLDIAIQ